MADRENRVEPREVVSLVYYLSRNGHLEHPHFIEIPLSSPRSLFLRDVINRLNLLRGKGMASQYSWSSKRSYKNGYVWHDLEEDDFIHPVHGGDYVLKGSEILQTISKSPETSSSGDSDFPAARNRNQSWDLHEYKVYKTESTRELPTKAAADASTQTEEKRRRKAVTELRKEEISPPPSDSSPETLESLMKADGRIVMGSTSEEVNPTAGEFPSGRMKASSVLMSLISCGSMSFRESGATEHGVSMVSSYRSSSSIGKMGLEDKEYFSGSVIDNKEDQFSSLKRSNSYNDDHRKAHMKMGEKEDEEVRVKCIPRRPKITQEISESGN